MGQGSGLLTGLKGQEAKAWWGRRSPVPSPAPRPLPWMQGPIKTFGLLVCWSFDEMGALGPGTPWTAMGSPSEACSLLLTV